MKRSLLLGLCACLFLALSCSKDDNLLIPKTDTLTQRGVTPCGTPLVIDLIAIQTMDVGSVVVENTADMLYVTIAAEGEWLLLNAHVFAGDFADLPTTPTGNPKVGDFPYKEVFATYPSETTFEIPLTLSGDYTIAAHTELVRMENGVIVEQVTAWGEGNTFPGKNWAMYFSYSPQPCASPDPDPVVVTVTTTTPCLDEQLRTQGQGSWGAPNPSPQNAAGYLLDHFAFAFPDGLEVGCDYTIVLETADDVALFLPTGGPPTALTADFVNPSTKTVMNVLAGQVTALALNLGFDAYDPDFGPSTYALADMIVGSGVLEGWTVAQVFEEANRILGGCASDYTAADVNKVVDAINKNYINGSANLGYLLCP